MIKSFFEFASAFIRLQRIGLRLAKEKRATKKGTEAWFIELFKDGERILVIINTSENEAERDLAKVIMLAGLNEIVNNNYKYKVIER